MQQIHHAISQEGLKKFLREEQFGGNRHERRAAERLSEKLRKEADAHEEAKDRAAFALRQASALTGA